MNEMKYPIDDIAPRDAALTIYGEIVAVREKVHTIDMFSQCKKVLSFVNQAFGSTFRMAVIR